MNRYLLQIAWECWNQKTTIAAIEKELDLELSGDWHIANDQIHFRDQDVVFSYAATYVYQEIIVPKLKSEENLYISLRNIWVKQTTNKSLPGRAIALAHNNRDLDLFDFAIKVREYQRSVFDFLYVIEEAVPSINHINLDTLFAWYAITSAEVNNTWNNGYLIATLIPYLKNDSYVRGEIIQRYLKQPEQPTSSLFKLALISIGQQNVIEGLKLSKEHTEQSKIEITIPAVDAMSYYDYAQDESNTLLSAALESVSSILKNTSNNDLKGVAAATLCKLTLKDYSLYRHLLELIDIEVPQVKTSIAEFLLRHVTDCKEQLWVRDLIISCSRVEVSETTTLNFMDSVLYQYVSIDIEIVLRFLEEWMLYQEQTNTFEYDLEEIFDSTMYALLETDRLPYLFTRWMASDSKSLVIAADHLIQSLFVNRRNEDSHFEYDLAILNSLDLNSIHKLVHRSFGYLFDQHVLLTLTWSLTKIEHDQQEIFRFVEKLFLIHLSYDYPEDTKEFLEKKLKGKLPSELVAICQKILQAIKSYQDNLNALPRLKEMESSDSKRNFIYRERDKQMSKSRDSARQSSVIERLASTIHLKFGRSSFSVHDSRPTEKIQLFTHEISYSLPRSEIIDPVGINRMRLIYRTAHKVKE